ncbi:hypothetical protein ScPMuIL_003044 [Solemya velum]
MECAIALITTDCYAWVGVSSVGDVVKIDARDEEPNEGLFEPVLLSVSGECRRQPLEIKGMTEEMCDHRMVLWVTVLVAASYCVQLVTGTDVEHRHESVGLVSDRLERRYTAGIPTVQAHLDVVYNGTINLDTELVYIYNYTEEKNKTAAIRVYVEADPEDHDYPVHFVVRRQLSVLSWQVPLPLDTRSYRQVGRTLCPMDGVHRERLFGTHLFYVDISTMSNKTVNYSLKAEIINNFEIKTGELRALTITPSEPQFFMYTFPEDVKMVIVRATATSTTCMILSVQSTKCPIFDLDKDVEHSGVYQTMSKQAAITVEKQAYGDNSFYIVLVVKPRDYDCNDIETIQPAGIFPGRSKDIVVEIERTISRYLYWKAILLAVCVFLAFYVAAFIIGVIYHGCDPNRGVPDLSKYESISADDEDATRALNPGHGATGYGSTSQDDTKSKELTDVPRRTGGATSENPMEDSLNTDDIDFLPDADEEKDVFRTKTALFVCDLSRKDSTKQSKRFRLYHKSLITVAIFYGLPVIQLVITYQTVLHMTGDQDMCYYNFDCSRPLGVLSSFNNVFSNIGYVLLGILFLILVYRRDVINKKTIVKNAGVERRLGIPQHYGLLYSMGIALCVEGIMSGCYHVCPNKTNFQFDTSFMYIIACLCMLKIYQNRHPDISARAHSSFLLMAFVIFIAVIGVVYRSSSFWIVFALVDMLCTVLLSIQIYYNGRWKLDIHIFKKMWWFIKSDIMHCARPMYMDRLILLYVGIIINWALAIFGAVKQPADFASFLLTIFISNLLLYSFFYIVMKIRSKEKIPHLTKMCIVFSMVTWGSALFFFFSHLTSWQLSAAQSRVGNKNCLMLDFFDAHDIWHFLSAISLFFSFLILLTLDDDLYYTRRDKIPVF